MTGTSFACVTEPDGAADRGEPVRPTTAGGPATAIVDVNLLDPESGHVVAAATILTRDGLVVSVDSGESVSVPDGVALVDAEGRWAIPGLIDTHTHLATNYQELTGRLPARSELDAMTRAQLMLYLMNGVTTIVNLGDFGEPIIRYRNEVLRGEIPGPSIIAAKYARGPVDSRDGGPRDQSVEGAADAALFFERALQEGYDLIKIYNWTPASAVRRILDLSRSTGVPVSGHFPFTLTPESVLEAGLSNVAHASAYHWTWLSGEDGPDLLPQAVRATLDSGASISTTLGIIETVADIWGNDTDGIERFWARPENVYMHWTERGLHERGIGGARWNPPGSRPGQYDDDLEAVRIHARQMFDAGLPLMAGTDSPTVLGVAGFSMHRELEALVRIGLTPLQAMAAATTSPGRVLARTLPDLTPVGRLVPGASADLILLDGDPRADLARLKSPWRVMARGTLFDPDELLRRLQDLQAR